MCCQRAKIDRVSRRFPEGACCGALARMPSALRLEKSLALMAQGFLLLLLPFPPPLSFSSPCPSSFPYSFSFRGPGPSSPEANDKKGLSKLACPSFLGVSEGRDLQPHCGAPLMGLPEVQGHKAQDLPRAGVCNSVGSGRKRIRETHWAPLCETQRWPLCLHRSLDSELTPGAAGEWPSKS